MQSTYNKQEVTELFHFIERQIVFTIETTKNIKEYHDFLISQNAMVLFNSTCMCIQTIGETVRQIDEHTKKQLFSLYPSTPWKQVIGMRNIISHEYLSVDPELVFDIVKSELHPLLTDVRQILSDIEAGLRDDVLLTPTNS